MEIALKFAAFFLEKVKKEEKRGNLGREGMFFISIYAPL
jgi:hypothetical protein